MALIIFKAPFLLPEQICIHICKYLNYRSLIRFRRVNKELYVKTYYYLSYIQKNIDDLLQLSKIINTFISYLDTLPMKFMENDIKIYHTCLNLIKNPTMRHDVYRYDVNHNRWVNVSVLHFSI